MQRTAAVHGAGQVVTNEVSCGGNGTQIAVLGRHSAAFTRLYFVVEAGRHTAIVHQTFVIAV